MAVSKQASTAPPGRWQQWVQMAPHHLGQWVGHQVQRVRLPRDVAMRMYLLANVIIYGGHGLARLLIPTHAYSAHFGALLLNSPSAQAFWTVTELLVAGCNLACFLRRSLRLWQVTAVGTAMWASAWACLLAILAVGYGGDYGGPFVWVGITIFHLIMIRNRFVSVQDEEAVLARYGETLAALQPYVQVDPLAQRMDDDEARHFGYHNPDHHRPRDPGSGHPGSVGSV